LGVLGLGMAPGHWAILMICDYGSQGSRIKSDVAIGQKYTQHMSKAFFFPPMHIYASIPVPCWGGWTSVHSRYFDPSQKCQGLAKAWCRSPWEPKTPICRNWKPLEPRIGHLERQGQVRQWMQPVDLKPQLLVGA
jgi:hypothetical protein